MQNELIMLCETCLPDVEGNLVVESTREYNLYDSRARRWLAKHTWWAAHNGYYVTTFVKPTE